GLDQNLVVLRLWCRNVHIVQNGWIARPGQQDGFHAQVSPSREPVIGVRPTTYRLQQRGCGRKATTVSICSTLICDAAHCRPDDMDPTFGILTRWPDGVGGQAPDKDNRCSSGFSEARRRAAAVPAP